MIKLKTGKLVDDQTEDWKLVEKITHWKNWSSKIVLSWEIEQSEKLLHKILVGILAKNIKVVEWKNSRMEK